jgi:hypothetical protein
LNSLALGHGNIEVGMNGSSVNTSSAGGRLSAAQCADAADAFVDLIGKRAWTQRMAELARITAAGQRSGRALLQYHGVEITIERLRRRGLNRALTPGEIAIAALAGEAVRVHRGLTKAGRERFRAMVRAGLVGAATLVGAFHVLRTAAMQRERGFEIGFAALEDAAPFDLMLSRNGIDAEIACDVISAEAGRDVHRGAWVKLVDAVDPDLQTWLAAHPGRYLLKMTLPQGLRPDGGDDAALGGQLADLHGRIRGMLNGLTRADHDEAAVLRLDPLMLAGAQADELGLLNQLRREFGHQAHLAVTASTQGVFVMAARAGREDEVAIAVRNRLAALAPARLTGTRPGILAMFVEDTDRTEWRHLRERLELEGEARQFLTFPEARPVVAVTCSSRLEMFGAPVPDAAPDGEMRFRNQAHPAAKAPALAPAVVSSL